MTGFSKSLGIGLIPVALAFLAAGCGSEIGDGTAAESELVDTSSGIDAEYLATASWRFRNKALKKCIEDRGNWASISGDCTNAEDQTVEIHSSSANKGWELRVNDKCIRARPQVWGWVELGQCGDKWSSWAIDVEWYANNKNIAWVAWGSRKWSKKVYLTANPNNDWLEANRKRNPWNEPWPQWRLLD